MTGVQTCALPIFDAKWGIMGADCLGAPHKRERIWIFAYPNGFRPVQREYQRDRVSQQKNNSHEPNNWDRIWSETDGFLSLDQWKEFTSDLCRVDDELANPVDRLARIGNGQVPNVAALAWTVLHAQLMVSNEESSDSPTKA